MRFKWLKIDNTTYVANLPNGIVIEALEGDSLDTISPALTFVPGLVASVLPDKSIDLKEIREERNA